VKEYTIDAYRWHYTVHTNIHICSYLVYTSFPGIELSTQWGKGGEIANVDPGGGGGRGGAAGEISLNPFP
jgi:hypothetical protein